MNELLLTLLALSVPLERFNLFLPPGFTLKAITLLIPISFFWVFWQKLRRPLGRVEKAMLFVLVGQFVSAVFSFDPIGGLRSLVYGILMFLLYLVSAEIAEKIEDKITLIKRLLMPHFAIALLAVGQFFAFASSSRSNFLENPFGGKTLPFMTFVIELAGKIYLRPSGTFFDPNTLAGYQLFGLLLSGVFSWVWFRSWSFFLSGMILTAFLLTFSRSGLLGLLISMLVLFVFVLSRYRPSWLRVLLSVLVLGLVLTVVGLLFWPFMGELWRVRWNESLAGGASLAGRLHFAQAAWAMFISSPLLGVGPGRFEAYYNQILYPGQPGAYSHSMPLEWLAEGGALGFLTNLWLLLIILKEVRAFWSKKERVLTLKSFLPVVFLAAYLGVFAANFFYAYWNEEFVWFYLGMMMGTLRRAKKDVT